MGRKETLRVEDLSAAVEAIYDAAMDEALWPRALERLTDLLGGNGAAVALDDGGRRVPVSHSFGYAPEMQGAYFNYYRWRDPMRDIVIRAPTLGVLTDRMAMPKAELRRLEIYDGLNRPNDIDSVAYAFAFRAPDRACLVVATRTARADDFEQEHVRTLGLLLPHLGRAMRVHVRLEDARARSDRVAEALDRLAFGVMLVDRHARVIPGQPRGRGSAHAGRRHRGRRFGPARRDAGPNCGPAPLSRAHGGPRPRRRPGRRAAAGPAVPGPPALGPRDAGRRRGGGHRLAAGTPPRCHRVRG